MTTPTRSQAGTSSATASHPTSPPTVSRSTAGGAGGKNDDRRRARREQLRTFYGIETPAGPGSPGPSKAAGGSEGQSIEGAEFDAPAYYQEMIGTSTLAELMKRAGTLTAEIGDLQSSRHSLVYNHHHKLFSAGDAIQVLNTRTPQLISIVTSLQDSFSSISQLADSVALPEPDPGAVDVDPANASLEGAERALARMRLMRTAELSKEPIREVFERIEPALKEAAEDGDARAVQILQEGRELAGVHQEDSDQ